MPGLIEGTGEVLQYAELSLTAGEIKALRANPKTLVAAPGAGKLLEFLSAVLLLDAGAAALTEATANLAVKYKDGTGTQVSQTVETTGFIDQTADQVTVALAKIDPITAKANSENQPLVLHNLGAAEYGGNAGNDAVLRVKVAYRTHVTDF